jgi:hypothetical protein
MTHATHCAPVGSSDPTAYNRLLTR